MRRVEVSLIGIIIYWGYIGILEKKMETTILGFGVYSPP